MVSYKPVSLPHRSPRNRRLVWLPAPRWLKFAGPMKIAVAGTRGIPRATAAETFAEELSTRLVQRGHEVTVYCREGIPRGFIAMSV
jgi:hypothetical protein